MLPKVSDARKTCMDAWCMFVTCWLAFGVEVLTRIDAKAEEGELDAFLTLSFLSVRRKRKRILNSDWLQISNPCNQFKIWE